MLIDLTVQESGENSGKKLQKTNITNVLKAIYLNADFFEGVK